MAKILIVIFCTLITQLCSSRQKDLDSLLNELKKHSRQDTVRLNLLNRLASGYANTNPDKGIEAADMAIALAIKLNDKFGLATAYTHKGANFEEKSSDSLALGLYQQALHLLQEINKKEEAAELLHNIGLIYQKSNYSKALDYYQRSSAVFEQLNNSEKAANVYRSIGVVYNFLSDYPNALKYQQKALKIYELSGNKSGMAGVFANMGLVYMYLENFKKALEYHHKSLEIFKELNNKKGMADELGNLGNVYDNMDDSTMALQSYQKALQINIAGDYRRGIASDLTNIGIIYNYYSKYSPAFEYLSKALGFYERSGDKSNTSLILNELAKIYCNAPDGLLLQKGIDPGRRYEKAIEYQKRALTLARENGSVSRQASDWESLSNTYEKQKDFSKALDAFKQAVILTDSALNDNKKQDITRLEMQYDFDKKEALTKATNDKKQALATAEINRQKIIRNASIVAGAIVLLASVAIFIFYKRRKDAIEKKKEAEFNTQVADTEMKALRAQMNPHFIFNSLNSINDYIDKNDTAKATLYATKFAKLMRMILENSEQKEIPLADDLKALELYMQLENMRMPNKFSYQIIVDENIDQENTLIPPLILQPFVENSIWHGISKKQDDGKIWIHIQKEGDMINCIVEDNGVGIHESVSSKTEQELLQKKSLGMKITNSRIDIINRLKKSKAAITLSNLEKGTKIEVKLPEALAF